MRRIVLFFNKVTINMKDEAILLNTLLVNYIKDCLMVYINSINLAIEYSSDKKDLLDSIYSFITKESTDGVLLPLIDSSTIIHIVER
jgi:hypothetical protein